MYNRYINNGNSDKVLKAPENNTAAIDTAAINHEEEHTKEQQNDGYREVSADTGGSTAGQNTEKQKNKGLFGGAIKLPDFNSDTVLMLVLVYFLISDELSPSSSEDGESKNNITDTLLIIGALLLLGF